MIFQAIVEHLVHLFLDIREIDAGVASIPTIA